MLKLTGITSLILSVAALLGCATTDAHQSASVLSAYVVLGENGTAMARAVTTDAQCPLISIDGINVRMDLRAAPATEPLRTDTFGARRFETLRFSGPHLREGDTCRYRCRQR